MTMRNVKQVTTPREETESLKFELKGLMKPQLQERCRA